MAALLTVCVLLAAGCTVGTSSRFFPSSHFSYPNSNVEPIGFVSGSASSLNLLYPDVQSAELEDEAIAHALRQKEGDMIVNMSISYEISLVSLIYLNLYITTVTVEGTAARMTVGKQVLK